MWKPQSILIHAFQYEIKFDNCLFSLFLLIFFAGNLNVTGDSPMILSIFELLDYIVNEVDIHNHFSFNFHFSGYFLKNNVIFVFILCINSSVL